MCDPSLGTCFNGVCTAWFSLKDGVSAVTNFLLCNSTYAHQGICINRSNLPSLQYNLNKTYHTCNVDSDCAYSVSANIYIPSNPCQCTLDTNSTTGFCTFGGGEKEIISSVNILKKRFKNSTAIGVMYYVQNIDAVMRNRFNLPGNCTLSYYLMTNGCEHIAVVFIMLAILLLI